MEDKQRLHPNFGALAAVGADVDFGTALENAGAKGFVIIAVPDIIKGSVV